jgi:hypothetical protein
MKEIEVRRGDSLRCKPAFTLEYVRVSFSEYRAKDDELTFHVGYHSVMPFTTYSLSVATTSRVTSVPKCTVLRLMRPWIAARSSAL